MKKMLFMVIAGIVAVICGSFGIAQANGEDLFTPNMQNLLLEGASARALVHKPVWEKLYTCTPDRTSDGVLEIIGTAADGRCQFKHVKYECALPPDITKQYAAAGIKSLEQIADGNFETNTAEGDFMDKIHNNPEYCTAK